MYVVIWMIIDLGYNEIYDRMEALPLPETGCLRI